VSFDRWHNCEIGSDHLGQMVVKKRSPTLGGRGPRRARYNALSPVRGGQRRWPPLLRVVRREPGPPTSGLRLRAEAVGEILQPLRPHPAPSPQRRGRPPHLSPLQPPPRGALPPCY
jgi:hypothetical protein